MEALGTHLLLDLKRCDLDLLDNLPYIKQSLTKAAIEAGGSILGDSFHKFSPVGVTGIIAIAESHLCIHTWPEYEYAAADIFTCGQNFKPHKAAELIIESLKCKEAEIKDFKRGTISTLSSALTERSNN